MQPVMLVRPKQRHCWRRLFHSFPHYANLFVFSFLPSWLTERQCLTMRENMTMLAMVLSALEDCRNGTTDSFQPLNISNQDAPEMVEQMLPMDHRSTMHNASHEKMH